MVIKISSDSPLLYADTARAGAQFEEKSAAPHFTLHFVPADRALNRHRVVDFNVARTAVRVEVEGRFRWQLYVNGSGPGLQVPIASRLTRSMNTATPGMGP